MPGVQRRGRGDARRRGHATLADDRLLVRHPAGGRVRAHAVRLRGAGRRRSAPGRGALDVQSFGRGGRRWHSRHTFAAPLTLTVAYHPGELPIPTLELALSYFDEDDRTVGGAAHAGGPGAARAAGGRSHLTLFAVTATFTYGAQDLPTVHGFTTDGVDRQQQRALSLALPPGPAGWASIGAGVSSERGERRPSARRRRAQRRGESQELRPPGRRGGLGLEPAGLGAVTVQVRWSSRAVATVSG